MYNTTGWGTETVDFQRYIFSVAIKVKILSEYY
jgi:hypothetical protein